MYAGCTAVLATQHQKEKAFARPVWHGLGLKIITPDSIDTDQLGTFSGEIARVGTMQETVLAKAKLGLQLTGQHLAFANEGSFGPHPQSPFIPCDMEMAVFFDAEKSVTVYEHVMTTKTNYNYLTLSMNDDPAKLESFLKKIGFPQHALIVKTKNQGKPLIYKGIQDHQQLLQSIAICCDEDVDHLAHIETDMRAHLNPTRQQALRKLAFKLVRKIRSTCPACNTIGWGMVDVIRGLPCSECDMPTQRVKQEVFGCVTCSHRLLQEIAHPNYADPQFCDYCNP